jgi:phospholipid/cholesterol/gamma-HCH transport system substrate-binding protein
MENRAHALTAGTFTVLLGFAVAAAVWWLSGKREETQELLLVSTRSVTGLNFQAQVRYRGIRTGRVQDISLNPDNAREILVRVRVPEWIPITTATTAKVRPQGVTGLAYVQLEDNGGGEPLKLAEGELPRIPLAPTATQDLGDAAAEIAGQLKATLARVDGVLDEENLKRVSRSLANLEGTTAGLNAAVKELQPLLTATKRVLSESNLAHVHSMLANMDRTSAQAPALAAEARGLVASLQATTEQLQGIGAGATAEVVGGTLPRLNQLLKELTLNSRQLSRVLEEIEGSPQVLLLGRGTPPPGPGERGFVAPR